MVVTLLQSFALAAVDAMAQAIDGAAPKPCGDLSAFDIPTPEHV
jgi:hypothetical protein